jgi:hypothetical protein
VQATESSQEIFAYNSTRRNLLSIVPANELILKPSKFKHIRISLGSLLLALCGAGAIPENPLMGWAGLIFFGGGGIFLLAQLFTNGSSLKLTDEGFEVRSMHKSNFTKWEDIADIFVIQLRHGISVNEMVGFNYSGSYKRHRAARSVSQALTESDGGLPDTYGMKAAELAELMLQWKNGTV